MLKSTPAKKVGNDGELDKPLDVGSGDAMECWSSLLPESTQGQYYVTVAGKKMLIIVKEKEEENKVSETDDEKKKLSGDLVIPESDL